MCLYVINICHFKSHSSNKNLQSKIYVVYAPQSQPHAIESKSATKSDWALSKDRPIHRSTDPFPEPMSPTPFGRTRRSTERPSDPTRSP